MRTLLLATNEGLAVTVLQSLAAEAIRADIMSPQRIRWGGLSRYSGKHVPCKLEHLLEPDLSFADAVNHHCSNGQIDIIIPVDVLPAVCLAKIRQKIEIPVFPISTVSQIVQLNNKWHFKQLLDQLGIQTPRTVLVNTREEVSNSEIAFPIMLKPVDREHGTGVKRVDSNNDIERYFSNSKYNGEWPLLIQDYIPGDDICTSVLCENGNVLYWTIQKRLDRGNIRFIEHSDLLESVRTICGALNYTGIAHFDARIDDRDRSVKFLECNPRFWGSLTASRFAGINFATLGVGLEIGQSKSNDITYQNGLQLSDRVTNLSILSLLIQRRIPFDRNNVRSLMHTLCDPLLTLSLIAKRLSKRIAKILIPGRIRRKQRRRKQWSNAVPPLSAIEIYTDHSE